MDENIQTNSLTVTRKPPYQNIHYIKPTYIENLDFNNHEQVITLKNSAILECQGDFIYFEADKPLVESMLMFQSIIPYCDEVVVETKNKSDIWGIYATIQEDIYRPFVVTFFNKKHVEYPTKDLQPEYVYTLENIYETKEIEKSVNDFLTTYIPSEKVIIQGHTTLAHILTLQYALQGACIELWYENIQIF